MLQKQPTSLRYTSWRLWLLNIFPFQKSIVSAYLRLLCISRGICIIANNTYTLFICLYIISISYPVIGIIVNLHCPHYLFQRSTIFRNNHLTHNDLQSIIDLIVQSLFFLLILAEYLLL